MTDIFEPGSSIKPFVVAAALASGRYRREQHDRHRRRFKVGSQLIRDKHDLGTIDLGEVLARSRATSGWRRSRCRSSRDADARHAARARLRQVTASGFPGESAGLLPGAANWRPINIATMSYGYGLSVTPLQLAQAYATVGAFGVHRPITFRRVDGARGGRARADAARRARLMACWRGRDAGGTGAQGRVPGYRVAGKTGTAWKAIAGGYSTDRYIAVFAGVVPATSRASPSS